MDDDEIHDDNEGSDVIEVRCRSCKGRGSEYIHCNYYPCPDCNGTGTITLERNYRVQ